jgi:hypothetical protein
MGGANATIDASMVDADAVYRGEERLGQFSGMFDRGAQASALVKDTGAA